MAEGPSPAATFFAPLFSFTPPTASYVSTPLAGHTLCYYGGCTLAAMDSSVFYPKLNIDIKTTER